jgi:hypothetical protein
VSRLSGWEYERRLEDHLNELDVPFCTEEALRLEGWAKTPDVRLLVPFGTVFADHPLSLHTAYCGSTDADGV